MYSLYDFNKLILDLENNDVQINDKNYTLYFLCLLSKMYNHFKKNCCIKERLFLLKEVQATLGKKS